MAVALANDTLANDNQKVKTPSIDEGDDQEYLPIGRKRRQYMDYVSTKVHEIEEQRVSRHYYHGAQWTREEIEILQKRRQPIVTFNRINRKIDGIVGLVEKLRADPKAFPRNPQKLEGAEVATESVRYVLDSNAWKQLDHDITEQGAIEGIAGLELKLVNSDQGNPKVRLSKVWGEDWYYDPRSRLPDFSDGTFHGLSKWLDIHVVIDMFPEKADEINSGAERGFDLLQHADQAFKWIYTREKRVRLVEHWYKHRGKWCWCFFVGDTTLAEGVSPFVDENGETMSRFFMFSYAVDHDCDRYGFVRGLKSPQDEVNQRRSKGLHISNSRRLILEKGAVDDVEVTRSEWAKADGLVEVNPGYADKIKPDETEGDLSNQMTFLQEAKNEIDSFANINPALLASGDPTEHSGVAIDLMQRAGLAELSKFVLAHRAWKLRVYRAIWNVVQVFWTAEQWLRITDDEQVIRFIQLNGVGIDRNPASPNFGRPILVNELGSLDVDIIMDEGPDVVSVMQDAYEILKDDPNVPASVKVEVSPLPGQTKKRIVGLLQQAAQNQKPDPKLQTEQIKQQTEMQKGQAEIAKARIAAQAEITNARQDALANQQEMALEAMEARNRKEELQMEFAFKREQHRDRMEELQARRSEREAKSRERVA